MDNNQKNTKLRLISIAMLLTTAIIWGFAFVAQRQGADHLGAFSFTGLRFSLGTLSLLPVVMIFEREAADKDKLSNTLKYGIITGVLLFIASNLQQYGIEITQNAGKAGFITGLYTVIIPVASCIIWRQKKGINVWLGALLAVVGLFLVSVTDTFSVGIGDVILLVGAFCWAAEMMSIEKFISQVCPLKYSMVQFATCGLLSLIFAFVFDMDSISFSSIAASAWPLVFGGVLSVGVAYTLQNVAQKNVDASAAAIIFAMEAPFGAIGGALFLNEKMSARGYIGCALILVALVVAQIEFKKVKKYE